VVSVVSRPNLYLDFGFGITAWIDPHNCDPCGSRPIFALLKAFLKRHSHNFGACFRIIRSNLAEVTALVAARPTRTGRQRPLGLDPPKITALQAHAVSFCQPDGGWRVELPQRHLAIQSVTASRIVCESEKRFYCPYSPCLRRAFVDPFVRAARGVPQNAPCPAHPVW
jgi:hypothetical protein